MLRIFCFLSCCLLNFQFAFAGTWEARELNELKYQIYLPTNPKAKTRKPLMINLHGCAQKPEDLVKAGNWEQAADQFGTVVVAPQVPNGGVIYGCWDYYGPNHTEQNHHHAPVLALVESLLKDPKLKIDPRRVYISGLSSGAGEALLLACLRPDLFAGVGLNSSPAVPSESQDISKPLMTSNEMAQFCKGLAGAHAKGFKTQVLSVIVADQDYLVNTAHSQIIVDAFREIYGTQLAQRFDLDSLAGNNKEGQGFLYLKSKSTARVSHIINNGLSHNWAAGGNLQSQGAYINQKSVNYPMYLLNFLESSNPR